LAADNKKCVLGKVINSDVMDDNSTIKMNISDTENTAVMYHHPGSDMKPSVVGDGSSAPSTSTGEQSDIGHIAAIIVGAILGVILLAAAIGFIIHRQFIKKNVKSMNFDNPVYKKTTEDHSIILEKNFQPNRSIPPTLEPLNNLPNTDLEV